MFANFTEETCTGTGNTLELIDATTGNIKFNKKFADGDLVDYVLEDSSGVIKVGGVGVYVSATDDITRNDTWNWGGTTYDDNPSTNIVLSGGIHTVRCGIIDKNITGIGLVGERTLTTTGTSHAFQSGRPGNNQLLVADRLTMSAFFLSVAGVYEGVDFDVNTAVAASVARCGVYSVNLDGTVGKLLFETANISTATSGLKSPVTASPVYLPVGWYVVGIVSDEAITIDTATGVGGHHTPFGTGWVWQSYAVDQAYENLGPGWSALPDPVSETYQALGFQTSFNLVQS